MKSIALDFDGVLHADNHPYGEFGPVKFGARDAVRQFQKDGFKCIVHTARKDLTEVEKWLLRNGFPKMEVTNIKPGADVYVDDHGYRLEQWSEYTIDTIKRLAKSCDHVEVSVDSTR